MILREIQNFDTFCDALETAGFSMGGENPKGIFSLSQLFADNIEWHTGDRETDPWAWRIRGITERKDFAYAKVFLKLGGWVTSEWYPLFYKVRRDGAALEELYSEGRVSDVERRVYEVINQAGEMPLHLMKRELRVTKETNSKFESALTGLQMKFFITICGEEYKKDKMGLPTGWPSTKFSTVEDFFPEEVFLKAEKISREEAITAITERIIELNPEAEEKTIKKFIG